MTISRRLRMMNPVTVASSSLVLVDYDSRRAVLQVVFRDGTAYQYDGVPRGIYRGLLTAGSKGAYFNHNIRCLFPHKAIFVADPAASGQSPT